jgi:hypothetical protein
VFIRRVYSIFKHLLNDHNRIIVSAYIYNFRRKSDLLIPIHPITKDNGLSWANPL